VATGDAVRVGSNGHAVGAAVRVREAAKRGTAYLIEGTLEEGANLLTDGVPLLVEIEKGPSAAKAADGFGEGR
jgi:hypothetical protein